MFEKFFEKDIQYLLKMDKLWEKRKRPTPLFLSDLLEGKLVEAGSSNNTESGVELKEQLRWSLRQCYDKFVESIQNLSARLGPDSEFLVWDKDDDPALDFVTAVSNFRSFCFDIERKSKFDVKSMAGNIIPAISSTNSIIGGLMGLQIIHLLRAMPASTKALSESEQAAFNEAIRKFCRIVYLRKVSLTAKNLVAGYELEKPRANCLVCGANRPEVEITCSLDKTMMYDFVEQIVINKLHFVCPDVTVEGIPTILYSKDTADDETPEEREVSSKRRLIQYPNVTNKTRLNITDLIQNHNIIITLVDEEVNPAENDGLFYKLKILSGDVTAEMEKQGEPTVEHSAAASDIPEPPVLQREVDVDVEVTAIITKSVNAHSSNGAHYNDDVVLLDHPEVICLSDDSDGSDVMSTDPAATKRGRESPQEDVAKRLRTD